MFSIFNRRSEDKVEAVETPIGSVTEPPVLVLDNDDPRSYWVSLDNSVQSPLYVGNSCDSTNYYAVSADGTMGYFHEDPLLTEFREATSSGDVDKQIQVGYKWLYESYCKKFPNEVEIWEMQLKLNKGDYSVTVPYIIEYLQKGLIRVEEKLVD